jgi:fermentation-respiration switch protein FrsA (DUF1100 family)
MKLVITSIVILLLFFIFIRFLEYKSLYYPFRNIELTPGDIGLDYEDVSLITRDGVRISGWFVPSEKSRASFLFAHGNAGNISHRLDKIRVFHELGIDTFIFDYRGYGKSEGRPSEKGLYLDADAAYEYLTREKKVLPNRIVGYGESLGGAVIIDLAAKHEVGGIIIENGFTSVADMARKIMPFIPAFVYKNSFDSLAKVKNINVTKLFYHSRDDEVVPFEQGREIFENAPGPKNFVELEGGHNEAFVISHEVYLKGMELFIDSVRNNAL